MKTQPTPWVAHLRSQILAERVRLSLAHPELLDHQLPLHLLRALDQVALALPAGRLLARVRGVYFDWRLTGPVAVTPSTSWLGGAWSLTQLGPHKSRRRVVVRAATIIVALLRGDVEDW